jgi:tetratricopeptide (TPR) repeat protein
LADIAPTILAWAGLAPDPASDGVSLVPALTGGELPSRPIYGDSVSLASVVDVSPVRFLRDGRWKLIHKPIPELYDLIADPAELTNQADREGSRIERMREQMRVLLAKRPEAEAPRGELDEKTQQQLASLGYVVGGSSRSEEDTIEIHGPDPTAIAAKLEPFVNALSATQFVDIQETADLLERLSREFPASSRLLEMMLDVQLGAGRTEQALATLRRGIEIDPDHKRYWTSLGELLMRLGRHAEARKALTETLQRWPCELTTRTNLANVHAQLGAREAQIAVLEQGIEQCNAPPELMNDLAYQLATVRVAKLRNGPRALELAEKMIGSLGDNPLALDTLAVAQAEAGRRDDARGTLARALDLAKRQRLPDEGLRVLQDHATKIAAGESIRE